MKMRFLAFLLAPLFLAAQAGEDAAKKDKEKLQGTWKPVSIKSVGAPLPEEIVKGWTLKITNDEHTVTISEDLGGGKGRMSLTKFTFTLDPAKKPKAIDFVSTHNGDKSAGIYSLEGDTLKICARKPGQERPTRFESEKGSGVSLQVYKRANPPK